MKTCLHCGKDLASKIKEAPGGNRVYCNWECYKASKRATLVCTFCGRQFSRRKRYTPKSKQHFCSSACVYEYMRSDKFLGEVDGYRVYKTARGYASIVLGRSNEKPLHVYLMEKHLGVSLEGKIIHHRDGNKLNNTLENLEVLNNDKEHAGRHASSRLQALGGEDGKHKYCPKCRTLKLLGEFYKSKQTHDRRFGWCKECAKANARAYNKRKKVD